MHVVFITPTSDLRRNIFYRAGSRIYGQRNSITGPLILGRILKDAGHDVSVYEELYGTTDYLRLPDVDVFCISTMTCTAPRAYALGDMFKKKTKARVIIGGMHASVLPEEAARHADQVVTGEAETVILDVVEGKNTNRIVHASHVTNLDDIPFPDYSILRTHCDCANILSTRGCPFSCRFCSTTRMFHPYRKRSVENVIEELRYYKQLGFSYMNFEDDNFTADKQRAKEICRKMIEEDLVFKETFFFGRTDLADDEELLELLQNAHCNRVLIGFESLNQKAQDEIDKHQDISHIRRCGEILARYKIRIIASLILGIDSDTKEDIIQGVDFAKTIQAYQLQPAVLTPYPGTPVYQQFEREGRLLTRDWRAFDMTQVTFQPKNLSPWSLQKLFFHSLRRFYSFRSVKTIWKRFGKNSGLRRLGLWAIIPGAILSIHIAAAFAKDTHVYRLKHDFQSKKMGWTSK